jgi:hypothetical protein
MNVFFLYGTKFIRDKVYSVTYTVIYTVTKFISEYPFAGEEVHSSIILHKCENGIKTTMIIVYEFCYCVNNVCINFVP